MELRDYVRILKKRIWLIVICVLAATGTTAALSYLYMKPVYEASTKLIVNKTSDTVGMQQLDLNAVNLNIRLIDTYKEIIKTLAIMDKVAQKHPELEVSAKELIGRVRVSSVNNTQVMTVAVQDRSYEKAAEIVNAVSEVFKNEIPSIMKVDNVAILNEANVNERPGPVKPNPKLNIAISLVVALMAATGIAFLLEYLDDTLKTEEDIAQTIGLPTLTMIARMKDSDLAAQGKSNDKQEVKEVPYAAINR